MNRNEEVLEAAKNYLEIMGLSKKGLYNQLIDGDLFTKEEAQYAIDNINRDWKQEAVRAARNYLEIMSFSKQGLINQLIDGDLFTREEAQYAANQVYK